MESDGFQIVRRTDRRKRRPKQPVVFPERPYYSGTLCDKDRPVDIENLKRRINLCCDEIVRSKFYAALTKNVDQAVLEATCTDRGGPQHSPDEALSAGGCRGHRGQDGNTTVPSRLSETQQQNQAKQTDCVSTNFSTREMAENQVDVNVTDFNIEKKFSDLLMHPEYPKKVAGKYCTESINMKGEIAEHKNNRGELPDENLCPPAGICEAAEFLCSNLEDTKDTLTEQFSKTRICSQNNEDNAETHLQAKTEDSIKETLKRSDSADMISDTAINEVTRAKQNLDNHPCCPDLNLNTSREGGGVKRGEEAAREEARGGDLRMVVYGLGNFASCLIARYQLALVLALRQHLRILPGSCETYDPKYTGSEKQILQDLGFTEILTNEEGKRRVAGATLVVMPHCGKALYNNLVWANWSPQQLQHLVVLGNSFSAMLDSLPRRLWHQHIGYIAKLEGRMMEVTVENSFSHTDVFNDLSVHWFPAHLLALTPPAMWSQAEEPVYDASDVEIILQSQT